MDLVMKILFRWVANAVGLWIAGRLIGGIVHADDLATIIWAGLALSVINSFVKPLIVLMALPAVLLSLGFFLIIINGFMVWLVGQFDIGTFAVVGFGSAVLAGLVIGLVNYIMTEFIEKRL